MIVKRLATHDVLRHVLRCHEFVSQGVGWSNDEPFCGASRDEIRQDNENSAALLPVSYTHLTLPTILLV